MKDLYGREITYLRLSITDRCNLRCRYCNPDGNINWIPHSEILSFEEIVRVCKASSMLGIKKIRLTGGEPLLRPDFVRLINLIFEIEAIEKICITTNGVLLEDFAGDIRKSGVRHINISLDTLKRERFLSITGMGLFDKVWNGIQKVISEGFGPIKINTVVMSGINDDEILDIAGLTLKYPLNVRFIEYMPLGCRAKWDLDTVVSSQNIKEIVENAFGELIPVENSRLSGPAMLYRIKNAKADIGFIAPITRHFCNICNRLRLTPEGRLRLCLFSDDEIDLKTILRSDSNIEDIRDAIARGIKMKPARHALQQTKRYMSGIGG
jgi:cyclic pyranopterin phosphate synthase